MTAGSRDESVIDVGVHQTMVKAAPRTGNLWTAAAHVITAVIGSGVLSLAWSIAQFGWVTGPVILLLFALVTYYASLLLSDCYRSPDPTSGTRNSTYIACVRNILGGRQGWLCGLSQYSNLVGASIGYTITAGTSMVAIVKGNCVRHHGGTCEVHNGKYLVIFGAIQLLFAQIPDINRMWWLSIIASIMSFTYSFIGLGLSVGQAAEATHGSAFGASAHTKAPADKAWGMLQALGNIAFAYTFSSLLIEIQDTIKAPPAENVTMKKATTLGVLVTTLFYMAVGCVGYAAFGDNAPGNLLTGFQHNSLFWLVDIANICIVIHLVGGYQVYAQPIFALGESFAAKQWPKSSFVNRVYQIGVWKFTAFSLVWRTSFVLLSTLISLLIPFFNAVIGFVGAITFWPLTVYFPIQMYSKQYKVQNWSYKAILLQTLSFICFLVTISAAVGSVQGIISSSKNNKPFQF